MPLMRDLRWHEIEKKGASKWLKETCGKEEEWSIKSKGILSFLAWHWVPFVPVECGLNGEGERFCFEFVEQMHLAIVSNLSGRHWLLLRKHSLDDTFSNAK